MLTLDPKPYRIVAARKKPKLREVAMGSYSRKDREFIWEHGGRICPICNKELDEDNWEADDILAMGHKGPFGGRPLCRDCHKETITYGRGQRGIMKYYTG